MKQKCQIPEKQLLEQLNESYALEGVELRFVPIGDSAYSYVVTRKGGERCFLKIYDTSTRRGRAMVERSDFFLLATRQLHEQDLFTDLAYPWKTTDGLLAAQHGAYRHMVFNFIEGTSLADAHPFSPDLEAHVGRQLGWLHRRGSRIEIAHPVVETFDISFTKALHNNLERLATCPVEDEITRQLRDTLLPLRAGIDTMMARLRTLRQAAVADLRAPVLCHGDVWGGNLILHPQGGLFFVDWEAAAFAPAECDLLNFLGEGASNFLANYESTLGKPALLNVDVYGFFQYRRHLRNLHAWLWSLLCETSSPEQRANDLDMIVNHCIDRWQDIEPSLHRLAGLIRKR